MCTRNCSLQHRLHGSYLLRRLTLITKINSENLALLGSWEARGIRLAIMWVLPLGSLVTDSPVGREPQQAHKPCPLSTVWGTSQGAGATWTKLNQSGCYRWGPRPLCGGYGFPWGLLLQKPRPPKPRFAERTLPTCGCTEKGLKGT